MVREGKGVGSFIDAERAIAFVARVAGAREASNDVAAGSVGITTVDSKGALIEVATADTIAFVAVIALAGIITRVIAASGVRAARIIVALIDIGTPIIFSAACIASVA